MSPGNWPPWLLGVDDISPVITAELEVAMAAHGLYGLAATRVSALVRELAAEPSKGNRAQYNAWLTSVGNKATNAFRMVGKKVVLGNLKPAQRDRLERALGEAVEARLLACTPAS